MTRPVRPIALVILTACMIYPGASMLFQALYPTLAGEYIMLVGKLGPWMDLAIRNKVPLYVPLALEAFVGVAWLLGVLGLWAGDGRALPLVFLAAVLSLLYPGGGMVMAVLALVVLIGFREKAAEVPA